MMAAARSGRSRRSPARSGRRRPGGAQRDTLAILAHRTNDLFVELAKLSARLERLEEALLDVRDECAKLVQRRLERLLDRRRGGTRRAGTRAARGTHLSLVA
jgi:hypothetical protein